MKTNTDNTAKLVAKHYYVNLPDQAPIPPYTIVEGTFYYIPNRLNTTVFETVDGRLFILGDTGPRQINYCPFTGKAAKLQMTFEATETEPEILVNARQKD